VRYYILGLSASGKTTFGKRLSKSKKIPLFSSDFVLSHYDLTKRKKIKHTKSQYMVKVKEILSKDSWIFEGKHLVTELLEAADKIILLKTPLSVSLSRQWKRYFTDKEQRKRFSFRNNLQLSSVIYHQHLGREDKKREASPRYAHVNKLDRILNKYKNKLIVVGNNKQADSFVKD